MKCNPASIDLWFAYKLVLYMVVINLNLNSRPQPQKVQWQQGVLLDMTPSDTCRLLLYFSSGSTEYVEDVKNCPSEYSRVQCNPCVNANWMWGNANRKKREAYVFETKG